MRLWVQERGRPGGSAWRDSLDSDGSDLGGSEYLELIHGVVAGRPSIDLPRGRRSEACRGLVSSGVVHSAHDCSDGGLAVALAECALAGGIGAEITAPIAGRWDAALFGEGQSRILVSLSSDCLANLDEICAAEGIPYLVIGRVSGADLAFGDLLNIPVSRLFEIYDTLLGNALEG